MMRAFAIREFDLYPNSKIGFNVLVHGCRNAECMRFPSRFAFFSVLAIIISALGAFQALAQDNAARTEAIFPAAANTLPSVPNCGFWQTDYSVFNPNPDPVAVTFAAYDNESVLRESASEVFRGYSGREAPFLKQVVNGWAKVSASQPVIFGQIIEHVIGCPSGDAPTVEVISALHLTPRYATRKYFTIIEFYKNIGTNTGLSIVYPSGDSTSIAHGTLIHRWVDGRTVSQKNVEIPANGQIRGFITELLPSESLNYGTTGIFGSLEVDFDRDVFIETIIFGNAGSKEADPFEPLSGKQ